jgi:TonB-linked SusC/RagA family outer membrane protein
MYKIYTNKPGVRNTYAQQILRIMRLTTIILTIAIMQVNAAGFAQNFTFKKNGVALKEVFSEIRKQTGYDVIWQPDKVDALQKINVNVTNIPIADALQKMLGAKGLEFNIKAQTIFIVPRQQSVLQLLTELFTSVDLKGHVQDDKGNALAGATVTVKGTKRSVLSGAGGDFMITDLDEHAVLLVSYIGYKPAEIVLSGQNNLQVVLLEDPERLDPVVVVGYGTTKRKDLVGSVASIKGEDMRRQVATNFTQALVGAAAGVQVSRPNGTPGAGASIRIRGISTVMGVNEPLYVIDGIPVQLYNGGGADALRSTPSSGLMDPLAGIDLNDIENIEILKDATASAIYGSRAANGVVIVTTKRGKAGDKPVFTFSYDASVDQQYKFHEMLSGPEYVKFMQDTYAAGGAKIPDVTFPGTGDTDWQRAISQTGLVQNMNIGLIGASKEGNTSYGFSSGMTDQKGILINSGFKRYSVRANVESKVFSLFKVGTNLNFSSSTQNGVSSRVYTVLGVASYRPDIPVTNPDGSYANDGSSDNPVALRQSTDVNQSQRLLASIYAELEILPGLKLRSALSYDINRNKGFQYNPSWLLSESQQNRKGSRTDRDFNYNNRIFDNTLTYTKALGKHHIDAVTGASWTLNRSDMNSLSSVNFPNDDVLNNLGSAGSVSAYSSAGDNSGLESFFLRTNYNYDGRYYLSLTGRADNSTKFGPRNQWGYFPSVGLAWRFSHEQFMQQFAFIDDAKLRLTTGKTGSSAFGTFGFLTLFNTGYFYNNINGLRANPNAGQPNPDIHWESTTQTDAALELSFLKSRLRASVNYYSKYTKGLITGPSIPVSSGYTFQTQNIGDVSNRGWEFSLAAVPVAGADFSWNSDFNITFNKNKVEKTYGTALYGSVVITEGLPLNGIKGYRTNGIYQNQAEIDQLNAAARIKTGNPGVFYQTSQTAPGDLRYVDVNGDGIINATDSQIIGYSQNPKYFGGWNNTFRYKKLDLSALFQYDVGSKLQREQNYDSFKGYTSNVSRVVLNGWTPQNPNNTQPRNAISGPAQNIATTIDRFTDDASYLRFKSIQLGYSFENGLLKKMFVQQIRVFAGMTNLVTWTNYKGLDPESNSENSFIDHGRDTATYPQARSVTFGFNFKF